MELKKGQIVISTAGHDKGNLMIVAGFAENRVLLADGKEHKLEKPKIKNPKHIEPTQFKIDGEAVKTNRKLRKILNKIANPRG